MRRRAHDGLVRAPVPPNPGRGDAGFDTTDLIAEVTGLLATRFFEAEQNPYMEGSSRGWMVSADYRATGDHAPRITNQERGGPGGWPPHGS